MIVEFTIFAIAFLLSAAMCYLVGRADGYAAAVETSLRVQREEAARRNLAINKQIIDHAIRREV